MQVVDILAVLHLPRDYFRQTYIDDWGRSIAGRRIARDYHNSIVL